MKRLVGAVFAAAVLFVFCEIPGSCAPGNQAAGLSSEDIARRAEAVARDTGTTGYCYAAVSRALRPLGIDLHGGSAWQAKDLLLQDERFVPLVITHVDQLNRGDIIVYQRSSAKPHGHISVYQGDYREASDHLAPVMRTKAYGGATVFRLRDGIDNGYSWMAQAPQVAPPFHPSQQNSFIPIQVPPVARSAPQVVPVAPEWNDRTARSNRATAWSKIRRGYQAVTGQPIEAALIRGCIGWFSR